MAAATGTETRLAADGLSVAYASTPVLRDLALAVADGRMTAIIGPNACGKSTLLRTLARLQPASSGQVVLDGKAIHRQSTRSVARRLAILPQGPQAPDGLRVRDLVVRGRTPHQSPLRQWSHKDAELVAEALRMTGLEALAHQPLDVLSGGQRQRAWIAMVLAQETPILLLDEPTTYLDLAHQIDLLALVRRLNLEAGRTVAIVLHDINLAGRFADRIVAMKNGAIYAEGTPEEVITQAMIRDVFEIECQILSDPYHGTPHIVPA
ncbi:MAG: ABC transporter ATP-binding protein [Pseudomonadota bacterium]